MEKVKSYSADRMELLEEIYCFYNDRAFVHPDPLEFLYEYSDKNDIEIAAIIASSLAYGRVVKILDSVKKILLPMGKSPYDYLRTAGSDKILENIGEFKHRFSTAQEIFSLLFALRNAYENYGSLEKLFLSGVKTDEPDYSCAMSRFSANLYRLRQMESRSSLIPKAELKSACKRLFLFLRWMAREDAVDPGCWKGLDKAKLLYPLDTHMHGVARRLGMTESKIGSIKTAVEITGGFRIFCAEDPVKYDFALTRPGIRGEEKLDAFFRNWDRA